MGPLHLLLNHQSRPLLLRRRRRRGPGLLLLVLLLLLLLRRRRIRGPLLLLQAHLLHQRRRRLLLLLLRRRRRRRRRRRPLLLERGLSSSSSGSSRSGTKGGRRLRQRLPRRGPEVARGMLPRDERWLLLLLLQRRGYRTTVGACFAGGRTEKGEGGEKEKKKRERNGDAGFRMTSKRKEERVQKNERFVSFPLCSRPCSRERLKTYPEEAPLAAEARKSRAARRGRAAEEEEALEPLAGAGVLRAAAAAAAEAAPGLPLLPCSAAVAAGTHREAPREAAAGAASRERASRASRASRARRAKAKARVFFFFPLLGRAQSSFHIPAVVTAVILSLQEREIALSSRSYPENALPRPFPDAERRGKGRVRDEGAAPLERERRRGRRDLNLASWRDGPFFFPSATQRGPTSPRPVKTEGESLERELSLSRLD